MGELILAESQGLQETFLQNLLQVDVVGAAVSTRSTLPRLDEVSGLLDLVAEVSPSSSLEEHVLNMVGGVIDSDSPLFLFSTRSLSSQFTFAIKYFINGRNFVNNIIILNNTSVYLCHLDVLRQNQPSSKEWDTVDDLEHLFSLVLVLRA